MQSTAVSSDPQTTPEAATAAALAMAGRSAPQGMTSKVINTNVVEVNGFFIATVVVELEPEPEPESDLTEDDGKQGSGEAGTQKGNSARDSYFIPAPQKTADNELAPPVPDTAEPLPQTPVVQSMEQLPDPDHDLLNPEVPDTALGPETLGEEAVTLAEDMRDEFNDQPHDLLVIDDHGLTPEQQASNEAHNQKALDAEETRREAAMNAAALAQDDLTPEPTS